MKKICILVLLMVLFGCAQIKDTALDKADTQIINTPSDNESEYWDKGNIKFVYPRYLNVVENEVSGTGDIHVQVQSADELIKCADDWIDDLAHVSADNTNYYNIAEERRKEHELALNTLKNEGLNEENYDVIDKMEAMTCGFAGGNKKMTPFTVSGLNGVIIQKHFGQDCCLVNSFKTQLMVIASNNDVYTITFDYDFGALKEHVNEDFDSENYFSSNSKEAKDVNDYFINGDPIEIVWLKGFEENAKIVNEIIASVEILNDIIEVENEEIEDVSAINTGAQILDTQEKVFINIYDSDKISVSSNNAYYVYGTTSPNCSKIIVEARNTSANVYDLYELKDYHKGDEVFKYGIRADWNNFGAGSNTYKFEAYCGNNQIVRDSVTLTTTKSTTQNQQTYIPTYVAPKTSSNYDEGYAWAEENDIDNFDYCQEEFGTGDAEDGCNEYVKENYTGYQTFHGYECTEDCSGHEAGYEWAEEEGITDVDDCDGNSISFIEGCEVYVEENY